MALAQPDDALLDHRHLLHRHLDPEVTPGDHDGVRGLDNALQVIYRLGLFDLGDDARMAVRRFDALAQVHHIGRGSHETQAHPVHAEGQGKGQVFPVLLRQAGQTDIGGREVEPLPRGKDTAVYDGAPHLVLAIGFVDDQTQFAVVQQNGLSRLHVFGKVGVVGPCHFRIAFALAHLDGERLAGLEAGAVGHHADAELGALHISQEGGVRPQFAIHGSDTLHGRGVGGMVAVRKIEADHIHPLADHGLQHLRRRAGRAHCRYDLGEFHGCFNALFCFRAHS